MKNQFKAGGKTYFVASNGSLKRVKGKKRRASLRAARVMPGDVLDFQTRANSEYWTVVNQHGERVGQMLKVFEGKKRDPKEFISQKGVTIGKVDGKPYRASKRASLRAALNNQEQALIKRHLTTILRMQDDFENLADDNRGEIGGWVVNVLDHLDKIERHLKRHAK